MIYEFTAKMTAEGWVGTELCMTVNVHISVACGDMVLWQSFY